MRAEPTAERGAAHPQDAPVSYLTFLTGNETFALDIRDVREIIQYASITPVPLMPTFIRGVINLRGAVLPVIDLCDRFGWGPAEISKKTCVIIFDSARQSDRVELGLMVDAVSEVVEVLGSDIEPAPPFGSAIQRDYIQGMGKVGDRFVVLMEPRRVLDVDELAQMAQDHHFSQ